MDTEYHDSNGFGIRLVSTCVVYASNRKKHNAETAYRLATVVSRGAVLATLHREAAGVRYLDCSIGFAWMEPYEKKLDRGAEKRYVLADEFEPDVKIVDDRAIWLFQAVRDINLKL